MPVIHFMESHLRFTLRLMVLASMLSLVPACARRELPLRPLPGLQPTGETLLPMQWSLKPAGRQLPLGDFPVNIAMHPKRPVAAVLHAGYGAHEVWLIDLPAQKVLSKVTFSQVFYGLAWDGPGNRLFASGAEHQVVHEMALSGNKLEKVRQIDLGYYDEDDGVSLLDQVIGGIAVGGDDKTLYVACVFGDVVSAVTLDESAKVRDFNLPKDSNPYAVLCAGDKLYATLWNASAVAELDAATGKVLRTIDTDPHPTEMAISPDGRRLFVACANACTVAVIDLKEGRRTETLVGSLYPTASAGSTPNSLALTPDGKVLFVANANNNNLAVLDVSQPGKGRGLGFIPVGWYPTSVRYSAADQTIYVANGKGLSSAANPAHQTNTGKPVREYIAGLFKGTLSAIPSPGPEEMAAYTKQAYACSPLREDKGAHNKARSPDNPVPAKVGDASPIKHCIYIVKENRTYDQVFGDMPEGNGDKRLCIFGEKITPNHHALARQYVLLDNFYVDGEVSADGHEWTMAAYATDFVEKTWPLVYRKGSRGVFRYPAEGNYRIAEPSAGYFWDLCARAGISYRSYGEFITNTGEPGTPGRARVKTLEGHFDPHFRSYDLNYPDVKRAERFIEELQRFEREGDFPRFTVLRLPNDHTSGTAPGKPTPRAMVADNDLALGMVIEALSKSRFWKETAVFVIEDDAQNGPDHVDAHRTVALVISPYTKRAFVDSNLYSTTSMLRTMELILGLPPMSQFDAAALPMYNSFQATPDLTPYKCLPARIDLNEKNEATAWGAQKSLELDLSTEDAADDLVFNDIIWRSVKGADNPCPAPVRAGFFFARPKDEDED